jgi:hypothetical protein
MWLLTAQELHAFIAELHRVGGNPDKIMADAKRRRKAADDRQRGARASH